MLDLWKNWTFRNHPNISLYLFNFCYINKCLKTSSQSYYMNYTPKKTKVHHKQKLHLSFYFRFLLEFTKFKIRITLFAIEKIGFYRIGSRIKTILGNFIRAFVPREFYYLGTDWCLVVLFPKSRERWKKRKRISQLTIFSRIIQFRGG